MPHLADADYRKVLEVVHTAGEVEGPLAFPEPVMRALRELVRCDVATFHERSEHSNRVLVAAGDPLGAMTADIREAHRVLKHEDPFRPADGPRTLEDFVSLRDFQRSDFYAFVHRPLGVEYMLQVYLDPARTDARLEFDRGDRAFDKRDREALCLLLPHLRRFLHAARRRELMPMPQVLTPREQEVLGHVASGGTNAEVAAALGISQNTVRKHLENVYAKLGVHTRTAAVAAIYGKETLTL